MPKTPRLEAPETPENLERYTEEIEKLYQLKRDEIVPEQGPATTLEEKYLDLYTSLEGYRSFEEFQEVLNMVSAGVYSLEEFLQEGGEAGGNPFDELEPGENNEVLRTVDLSQGDDSIQGQLMQLGL